MSFFSNIGDSFSQVFTNPTKANFGDFASVLGTFGAVGLTGSAIASLIGPGAGAAAAAGGAEAAAVGAGGAAVAEAGLTIPASAFAVTAADFAAPGALGAAGAAAFPAAAVTGPGIGSLSTAGLIGADFGTPAAAAIGGSAAGGGLWASIKSFGSGAANFVKGTAAVSSAAQEAISPWRRAVSTVKETVQSYLPAGRPVYNVSGGGQIPAGSGTVAPAQAASGGILVMGLVVTAAVVLAIRWWRRR